MAKRLREEENRSFQQQGFFSGIARILFGVWKDLTKNLGLDTEPVPMEVQSLANAETVSMKESQGQILKETQGQNYSFNHLPRSFGVNKYAKPYEIIVCLFQVLGFYLLIARKN